MEKFKKGDRVWITEEGKSQGLGATKKLPNAGFGVVVAHQSEYTVRVLRDGTKGDRNYHCKFWEKV